MDEIKKLKLHIRVLYIALAVVVAWTVILALLPPKSHYRDVTFDDITIIQPSETAVLHIAANKDIIGYSVKYILNGKPYERVYGNVEKGHEFTIGLGGFCSEGVTLWEVTELQIYGKIDTHLE